MKLTQKQLRSLINEVVSSDKEFDELHDAAFQAMLKLCQKFNQDPFRLGQVIASRVDRELKKGVSGEDEFDPFAKKQSTISVGKMLVHRQTGRKKDRVAAVNLT